MSDYDWQLSAGAPLCMFSDSFYSSVRNAIFQQLTKESTKEQFQAALEHLQQLRDELVKQLYPMHYGSLVGGHRCVDHLYREAVARLRGLEIMHPAPVLQQPEEPAPEPQEPSLEDVVDTFEAADDLFLSDTEQGDSKE
jgi:hypothetical protein